MIKRPHQIEEYQRQAEKLRNSTFINCWSASESMSLSMWELFGGGLESVAIKTTKSKLRKVVENYSSDYFNGEVVRVNYLDNLIALSHETNQEVWEIISQSNSTISASFSIKPIEYQYESEVRAIFTPTKTRSGEFETEMPTESAIKVPIHMNNKGPKNSMIEFIEEVHIHPFLDEESMFYEVVRDINYKYDIGSIPVKSRTIKALEKDLYK